MSFLGVEPGKCVTFFIGRGGWGGRSRVVRASKISHEVVGSSPHGTQKYNFGLGDFYQNLSYSPMHGNT